MAKKTKQKQDEEVVVITTEVSPEWSRTLKAEARRQKPRLSRKALVYLIISKAVRRIEAGHIKKLSYGRCAVCAKFEVGGSMMSLGLMDDNVRQSSIAGGELQFKARKDAEAKAEEERIEKERAEAAERERTRKENEQLKAEAEERDKKDAERRKRYETEALLARLRQQDDEARACAAESALKAERRARDTCDSL